MTNNESILLATGVRLQSTNTLYHFLPRYILPRSSSKARTTLEIFKGGLLHLGHGSFSDRVASHFTGDPSLTRLFLHVLVRSSDFPRTIPCALKYGIDRTPFCLLDATNHTPRQIVCVLTTSVHARRESQAGHRVTRAPSTAWPHDITTGQCHLPNFSLPSGGATESKGALSINSWLVSNIVVEVIR